MIENVSGCFFLNTVYNVYKYFWRCSLQQRHRQNKNLLRCD